MRNLRPFKSATRLDLLAEPAAHLGTGVAGAEADDVVVLQELVVELRGRRRGTSTRSAAARSSRTEWRTRTRTSDPCRRSSKAPCGSTGPSRSARRRPRRTPGRFPRRRIPGSGTCCWSPTATRSEIVDGPPKIVSSAFGKLDARRHLTSGAACANAGAEPAARMPARPVCLRNERRSIDGLPPRNTGPCRRVISCSASASGRDAPVDRLRLYRAESGLGWRRASLAAISDGERF